MTASRRSSAACCTTPVRCSTTSSAPCARRAWAASRRRSTSRCFTDGLLAEREQGITIDVAYRYFSTETRKFIIADTPGHEQYTRNMATGASTADIAIILLDARLGVLPQSPQARDDRVAARHLAAGRRREQDGPRRLRQARFDELKAEFAAFTAKLHFDGVSFVPVSAKRGDNVVAPSDRTPWYGGPTLLGLLETLPVRRARPDEPFSFPVQSVVRPNLDYRGFAGFVARGIVRAGDEVVVLPSGRTTRVASVDTFEGSVTHAPAPLSVTLRLTRRGRRQPRRDDRRRSSDPPVASCDVTATLVWLSERAFDPHRKLLLKHTSRWVPARVAAIEGRRSLGTLELEPTTAIQMNDIAVVRLHTTRPIFTDPYLVCRATGAFILVDALDNGTVAAGMVSSAIPMRGRRAEGPVSAEERAERLGHRAAAVALTGEAVRVERALFERGVFAVALEPQAALPEVVGRLCSAGLVVLLVDLDDAQRAECLSRAALALDMRATSGDVAQHILEIVTAEQVDTGAGI
jgi:bifunctional enzyme CysN/CysC